MSRPVHLVVPGPLDQRTGGFIYDRRIADGLRALGRTVVVHELEGVFPAADETARRAAARAIEDMHGADLPLIDGLALPAFEHFAFLLPRPWVALVHHPLALETGVSADEASRLAALERRLLAGAERIIVTSPQTRRDLEAYEVSPDRVGIVLPGTERAPLARGSGGPCCAMLCVASLTLRKGHLVLLEALGRLSDLDWRLTCVGSAERDPACARTVRGAIRRLGLEERVRLVGERDGAALGPFYDAADLFVLASHHEGFGMVLADALARGLPIVSTTAGAIPETVPSSAGLLVPPGDGEALAGALARVIAEPELRARLAEGAQKAREHLPGWAEAARAFAAELDRVAAC
jgi:glycosyltransferase involved in cell wall biosynthesis